MYAAVDKERHRMLVDASVHTHKCTHTKEGRQRKYIPDLMHACKIHELHSLWRAHLAHNTRTCTTHPNLPSDDEEFPMLCNRRTLKNGCRLGNVAQIDLELREHPLSTPHTLVEAGSF